MEKSTVRVLRVRIYKHADGLHAVCTIAGGNCLVYTWIRAIQLGVLCILSSPPNDKKLVTGRGIRETVLRTRLIVDKSSRVQSD
jgi:hypothetical protein